MSEAAHGKLGQRSGSNAKRAKRAKEADRVGTGYDPFIDSERGGGMP